MLWQAADTKVTAPSASRVQTSSTSANRRLDVTQGRFCSFCAILGQELERKHDFTPCAHARHWSRALSGLHTPCKPMLPPYVFAACRQAQEAIAMQGVHINLAVLRIVVRIWPEATGLSWAARPHIGARVSSTLLIT
ncbi:unnamed protein product [Gadus morhua 'NCC']